MQLPGLCRVSRGGLQLKIDPKKKAGAHGGNPTLQGINPQPFEIEIMVWTNEQLEALLAICKQILPPQPPPPKQPGKPQEPGPLPLVLQSPWIAHLGTVKVIVLGCGVLEPAGVGRRKLTLHLQHWLPAPKGTKSIAFTPTRAVRNARTNASAAKDNPSPTEQPENFTPAINYTPARGR